MKAASSKQLKDELKQYNQPKLLELCLRLARFKKENKELLTYLVFEADSEGHFVEEIKEEMNEAFANITAPMYYYMKKSIRKILRDTKKHIRYSNSKETEVILLLHFCQKLIELKPPIKHNTVLLNMYIYQMDLAKRRIAKLEDDLQYDYTQELNYILSQQPIKQ